MRSRPPKPAALGCDRRRSDPADRSQQRHPTGSVSRSVRPSPNAEIYLHCFAETGFVGFLIFKKKNSRDQEIYRTARAQSLKLGRWKITERFVQAVVVEPGDPLDDCQLELGLGAPNAVGDEFGLEGVDEAFGHRVVGVADGADRSEKATAGRAEALVKTFTRCSMPTRTSARRSSAPTSRHRTTRSPSGAC